MIYKNCFLVSSHWPAQCPGSSPGCGWLYCEHRRSSCQLQPPQRALASCCKGTEAWESSWPAPNVGWWCSLAASLLQACHPHGATLRGVLEGRSCCTDLSAHHLWGKIVSESYFVFRCMLHWLSVVEPGVCYQFFYPLLVLDRFVVINLVACAGPYLWGQAEEESWEKERKGKAHHRTRLLLFVCHCLI